MTEKTQTPKARLAAGFALLAATVLAALVFMPLLSAGSTAGAAVEIAQEVGAQAGANAALQMLRDIPMLNSAGDHVYAEAYINDGTGVVTTPADGGVIAVVKDTPLTAGETDGSGCLTFSATTGLFTVAKRCGVGEYLVTACVGNLHGGNVATTTTAVIAVGGTEITDGMELVKTEVVDAGTQASLGCIQTVQDLVLADTVGLYLKNSGATGIAQTTRQASIRLEKKLNK